jgi:hypothetical protein
MTDIILDEAEGVMLVLEAGVVKMTAWDVLVDSPIRRGTAGGEVRRALVHSGNDSLTINFDNDYTGGLFINGVAEIVPKGAAPSGSGIAGALRRTPNLVIRGGIQFEYDVAADEFGTNPSTRTTTLQGIIENLKEQIAALETRVAALEAR